MSAPAVPKKVLQGAALAPLVYWLLVICGLAGITVLRFGSYGNFVTSDDVFALWAGSVAGIALGQLASAARIRAWVPVVVALFGFWFLLPILALVLDGIFGATAQTFVLAFLPASICGYLSLTERGALLSFWYPAVLWMIVILDGPTPGVFDEKFALPFVVGLAALFVVYLRARETRRVAIWKAHANERLADALPRTVLRASPLRAAAQHVFSAMIGAMTLVMTAWIAPHLWQTAKDPSHGAAARAAAHASASHTGAYAKNGTKPCCGAYAKEHEKVKEYFPLQNSKATDEDDELSGQCRVCAYEAPSNGSYIGPWSYNGSPGSGLGGGFGTGIGIDDAPSTPYGYGSYGYGYGAANPNGGYDPYAVTSTPTTTPSTLPATTPTVAPLGPPTTTPPVATTAPVAKTNDPSSPIADTDPNAPATSLGTTPTVAPVGPVATTTSTITFPAPWKSSLGLCTLAFGMILFSRATRRALTLRHLARPFWSETLDQRISNHWQRILIGLRDAGLQPSSDEQPQAFARRIGIEGMETCATILERVRHGVRVETSDLQDMAASAERVYRAARERAGIAGRATAWLRWPMV